MPISVRDAAEIAKSGCRNRARDENDGQEIRWRPKGQLNNNYLTLSLSSRKSAL